jgi:TatD DNase family protein
MLFDSHCHLDHHLYAKDIKQVLERAKKARIKVIITNGIDYETNLETLKLAELYPIIKPALGFYPEDALDREGYFVSKEKIKIKTLKDSIKLIEENKDKIVAIGEVGLDLHHGKDIEQQTKDFERIIELAIKLRKPIIVHTRKAEKETLALIEKSKIRPNQVILHCFSGNRDLIQKAINSRYTFSIPTNLVRSEEFQHLIEVCPLNQILTETDGPYLSPYKNEDKSFNRNEPAHIQESIKKIAKIKKISESEVEKQIESNFKRIFNIT